MAAEEEDKRPRKVFTTFHLDGGLIILEDGKRMPSEIYANESITKEVERLESENRQLEDMLRSRQTTIAKVSEELEAKFKFYYELNSRKEEHPIMVEMYAATEEFTKMEEAAIAGKKQMEKVFSMFHLDDGLIILEDGKRMRSEIYANASITKEVERLESENQQLEDMLRSLQTNIAKVSEELKAKLEKHTEVRSRQREHPEVIKFRAAVAEQELQMEAECEGFEGGSKRKRIAKRGPSKKCPWK